MREWQRSALAHVERGCWYPHCRGINICTLTFASWSFGCQSLHITRLSQVSKHLRCRHGQPSVHQDLCEQNAL